MTLKNSVRHVWRSFAIRLFTGIYKCSKCLHFEKKYVVFFLFFYFGQILLQNVLCTTLLVENSTHQVILIPKSDLVCSLKYCNALLLQNQFFFSFFSFLFMCLTKSGLTSQIIRMYIKFPIFSCIICPRWWTLLRDSISSWCG